jgi:sec-independent protein translocase protein TatA
MLGLDNPVHLLLLLGLLLLLFGAKRLPEMGRSLGAGLRGFKESINGDPAADTQDELETGSEPAPASESERASAA